MTSYAEFLARKAQSDTYGGFDPVWMPDFLFDFQRKLVEWATRKGKAGIFADCGLGKSPMQLVWAENVVRKTNRPVLIATPLAVSHQVVAEATKFGIDCRRVTDGKVPSGARLIVTNYERVHLFQPDDFSGMVCDESSILKNYDGARRAVVNEFLRTLAFRLLCTATAAPNDYIELGTSSEALGEMGHLDMLSRFFRNEDNNGVDRRAYGKVAKWRFKGHAEAAFWKWVCSWARAVRRPSDLGCDDRDFVLPELTEREHVVSARRQRAGFLFSLPATNMREEREERRRTIQERCEQVAELTGGTEQSLVWCHLNPEGDLLEKLIPGARQAKGSQSDDEKEELLMAFASGELRVLVTKPKIGAWGLNLQRCAHVTFFPSHSYEQYYQGVRRCWRFGQKRPVTVDVIATDGERGVMDNLRRKAAQADRMFSELVRHMNDAMKIARPSHNQTGVTVPAWMR